MKIQLFFAVLVSLFIGQRASASMCIAATPEKARDWADVIFAGEITKVQYVDTDSSSIYNEPRIIVTFKVSDAWKGDVRQTMTLYTNYNKVSLSGLIVKQGEKWLIYAKLVKAKNWLEGGGRKALAGIVLPKPDDGVFEDGGFCLRSNLLDQASTDLKALGKPKVPDK